jgi:hypothetical protein
MTTLTIPTRNDVFFYSQQVTLENVEHTLTFDYNRREDSWFISFGQEQDILTGIRLSGNNDILDKFHHLEVPPGELKILDLDGLNREPTKDTFSTRIVLQYVESNG